MDKKREDAFDLLISDLVEKHFPELLLDHGPLGWLWVKAQIWQESRMNPKAISPAGAQGLMQLMPATDLEIDGKLDGEDVVGGVNNGIRYLADQYRHLTEIVNPSERIRFSLASYNGGRGYINFAMVIARDEEGLPGSFKRWNDLGRQPGLFQAWKHTREYLKDKRCKPGGKYPDWKQMFDYVERIERRYWHYVAEASEVGEEAPHGLV